MSLSLEIAPGALPGLARCLASMLKLPRDTRVFMAVTPVEMRRSFSGL